VGRSGLLALALRFRLSSYEAAYLEMALRLQCPFAAQDEALIFAAQAAWVDGGPSSFRVEPSIRNSWS